MTDLKTLALAARNSACLPGGMGLDAVLAYRAAASPDAILKLLAERDRLREALKDLLILYQGKKQGVWGESLDQVKAARQALNESP